MNTKSWQLYFDVKLLSYEYNFEAEIKENML